MVDRRQVDQWVSDYGEDSDFVRVRVRGEFPRAGSNQFISGDYIENCVAYRAEGYESQAKILAVDVARFGDDSSVLCLPFNQGRKTWPLIKYKGLDLMMALSSGVIECIENQKPDAVVVDGVGIGAGVVDRLKQLGYGDMITELNGGGVRQLIQRFISIAEPSCGD